MDRSQIWPDFRETWVIYRDDDLIAVSKPTGVSSQAADPDHPDDLVFRLRCFLAAERGCQPSDVYLGVHQRLDKQTSGLIVYTLRKEVNGAIARQFADGTVKKVYLAAVSTESHRSPPATLVHHLTPRTRGRVRVAPAKSALAKPAVTHTETVRSKENRALVRLRPLSGRTHQLRVQLAAAGAPVAGDRQYDGASAPRLMLHAASLRFAHPVDGRPMSLEDPPPPELADWVEHGSLSPYGDLHTVERRVNSAVETRWGLGRSALSTSPTTPTTAFRIINGAGDGLPGLAVDAYAEWLVAHVYSDEVEAAIEPIVDILHGLGWQGIYLKCHPKQANIVADTRDPRLAPSEPVRGVAAPSELLVLEHGHPFLVKLNDGLRTGLFLDQRENRQRVLRASGGKRVLNLFAYTGGFSAAALAGKANEVVSVDNSTTALNWCKRNIFLLHSESSHRAITADVFEALARFEKVGERFDLLVIDPPSYSTSRTRRFRVVDDLGELLALAMRVTSSSGSMLASVNHRGISPKALRRYVLDAARSVGRTVKKITDLPTQTDFPLDFSDQLGSKSVWSILG
jgi:23S rRNA (cytosine1962-C5)-methyltransferase